jgi:hypothetical protein
MAEALNVRVGNRLTVKAENGRIIFEKFMPLKSLAGILNPGFKIKDLARQLDRERKREER